MMTIFKSHGLWNLVDKGVKTSDSKKKKAEGSLEDDVDGKMAVVLTQDAKALGIIQNAVSDQIFPRITNSESAKMAWDLLYGEYHGGDQTFGEVLSYARLVQKPANQEAVKPQCKVCSKYHFGECIYKGKPKCYNCDKFGHLARECTAAKTVQKANSANQLDMTGNLFYANNTVTGPRVNGEWYINSG
ncbi:unnamed protein product [Prunus armeniaca]